MFVVDTNVLVYAVNEYAPENQACRAFLDGWRRRTDPWHIAWSVVYEFLSVTTDRRTPRPLSAQEASSFIESLFASPALSVIDHTPSHGLALGSLVGDVPTLQGRFLHDAHIVALMREHGVRTIYTRDSFFRLFPGLEVIDPLAA